MQCRQGTVGYHESAAACLECNARTNQASSLTSAAMHLALSGPSRSCWRTRLACLWRSSVLARLTACR